MTMVPSQSSKQNSEYVFYSNTTTSTAMNQVQVVEGLYNNNCFGSEFVLRHMADHEEEDYSSSSRRPNTHHNEPEPEPEPVSTSRQEEQGEGANNNNNNNNNWLQLSIGFHQTAVTTTTKNDDRDHHHDAPSSGSGLLELELLPTNWASSRPNLEPPPVVAAGRGCSSNFGATNSLVFEQTTSFSSSSSYSSMSMSMSIPSGPTFGGQQQQILPHQWAFGPLLPLPHSMPTMPSSTSFINTTPYSSSHSSSSSLRPPLGSYNYPPHHHHHHQYHAPFHFPSPSPSSSGFDQFDVAGPSSHVTVRVVDPPRRPHSGIWFMLQASQNQAKEPYLPQIPKNYLRIKDGRMTVRLLLKYLVSKLKLDSESEIEITCRGQQLLPFLTLQHVRDNIWTPRDTTSTRALLSDSSTTDHVMVLHYGRSTY